MHAVCDLQRQKVAEPLPSAYQNRRPFLSEIVRTMPRRSIAMAPHRPAARRLCDTAKSPMACGWPPANDVGKIRSLALPRLIYNVSS